MGLIAVSLASCNTFIGMGRDIQQLGRGFENKGYGKTWDGKNVPPRTTVRQQAPATAR